MKENLTLYYLLRNMYLPMFICNEFPEDVYGDLDICLGATAGDRVLDKSPEFAKKFNDIIKFIFASALD